jgi:hypothetical protein
MEFLRRFRFFAAYFTLIFIGSKHNLLYKTWVDRPKKIKKNKKNERRRKH